jgi:hypothetical protein
VEDEAPKNVLKRYKLSLWGGGHEFQAVVVSREGKLSVMSNREGVWGPDHSIHFADLIMPEQRLHPDWDVTPLEVDAQAESPKLLSD